MTSPFIFGSLNRDMEYPSKSSTITYGEGTPKEKSISVYSCDKCGRYAEHFAYQFRTTQCRYCNFKYEEEGHLVFLPAYGKIKFASFREYKGILLKHALANHPEHFKKKSSS